MLSARETFLSKQKVFFLQNERLIGNIENQFQRIQKNTNYRLQVNRKDISEAKLKKANL